MPMKLDASVIIFLVTVMMMLLIVKLLRSRVKTAVRIVLQVILGAVFIVLFNYFANSYGVSIPLNPLTSFIAGVLQIPGVAFLLVLKYVIYA